MFDTDTICNVEELSGIPIFLIAARINRTGWIIHQFNFADLRAAAGIQDVWFSFLLNCDEQVIVKWGPVLIIVATFHFLGVCPTAVERVVAQILRIDQLTRARVPTRIDPPDELGWFDKSIRIHVFYTNFLSHGIGTERDQDLHETPQIIAVHLCLDLVRTHHIIEPKIKP
ncbi:hypothetical protein N7454_006187 [Penicillium verhagenii]|nr:hypothetical protein N7454_006187 [Penicillium verhagenii]